MIEPIELDDIEIWRYLMLQITYFKALKMYQEGRLDRRVVEPLSMMAASSTMALTYMVIYRKEGLI